MKSKLHHFIMAFYDLIQVLTYLIPAILLKIKIVNTNEIHIILP